jgi:hypothetical protein
MESAPHPMSPASRSVAAARSGLWAIIEDGVVTGIMGAAVVAVWFLILDFVRGVPFFTPSLLGSVLFLGELVDEATTVSATMVFAYTGLHGLLFLIAGVVIAWMFSQFEQNPQLGMVLLLLFMLFESILLGLEVTVVPHLVGALGTWAVGIANLLSAIAMFWFLLRRRPGAWARLRAGWSE